MVSILIKQKFKKNKFLSLQVVMVFFCCCFSFFVSGCFFLRGNWVPWLTSLQSVSKQTVPLLLRIYSLFYVQILSLDPSILSSFQQHAVKLQTKMKWALLAAQYYYCLLNSPQSQIAAGPVDRQYSIHRVRGDCGVKTLTLESQDMHDWVWSPQLWVTVMCLASFPSWHFFGVKFCTGVCGWGYKPRSWWAYTCKKISYMHIKSPVVQVWVQWIMETPK